MSNIARRPDPSTPQAGPAPVEGERYTVLLLDEDQLDRLLTRPQLRNVGPRAARTVDVWSSARRVKTWGAVAAIAVLAVTAAVWLRAAGDKGDPPVVVATPVVDESPAVTTGASFSVQVASFARDREARGGATRLTRAGLLVSDSIWPAFLRG